MRMKHFIAPLLKYSEPSPIAWIIFFTENLLMTIVKTKSMELKSLID